jgi:hypothetical protein
VAGSQHPLNLADVFAHVDRHREEFVECLAGWGSASRACPPPARACPRRWRRPAAWSRAGLDARVEETAGWPLVLGHRAGMAAAQGTDPLLVPTLGGSLPLHVFTGVLAHLGAA